MGARHPVYRVLVRLYPGQFRRAYGEDLVQHFDDLVSDRGAGSAWARTCLDFTITVPRYHLEQLMNDQRSSIALSFLIIGLAAGGVATFLTGTGPPSAVFFLAAGALAVTQRSAIAKALRVPDTGRRHRRLSTAVVLGAVFIGCYIVYSVSIGDSWTIRETVLASMGTLGLLGAIGFLVAGLATPRSPEHVEPGLR